MEANRNSREHKIDVENLVSSIEKELENICPPSNKPCIHKVPKRLRDGNEKDYTPRTVSIGPYHHGKQELSKMEEFKKISLKGYLEVGDVNIKTCLDLIIANEKRLRDSYAEEIKFSSHEFVKMMLLDAVFLIWLVDINSDREDDLTFCCPWNLVDFENDLAMIENQIPFFIVKELFELSKIPDILQGVSIYELFHDFIRSRWPVWVKEPNFQKFDFSKVNHIVDFLRIYLVPLQPNQVTRTRKSKAPSITELNLAGVKFNRGSNKDLFDIKFQGGVLEIPQLSIGCPSGILFRNVMAFEQIYSEEFYVNDCISIIGKLVRTSKDVELLVQERILLDAVDNTEALLCLFRDLHRRRVESASGKYYFSDLSEQLRDYYRKPWHKWNATLKQEYFNNPWAVVSVIAASILLLLSLLQTACAVLDQTRPK